MYNAFWRLALFVRGQSFSVKIFDRSRNGCQVIREGAGNDFRGPSVQALPLPSRVSFSRARFFLRPLLPSACYAGYDYWKSTYIDTLAKGFNVCFSFSVLSFKSQWFLVLMQCTSVSAVLIRSLNFCVLFIFSCNLHGFLIVQGFFFPG